ncbi:CLCA_X family protein [Pseudoalteromonas sp. T1lg23B]|uniref:CLCA_X family protein n=1 Tax=Pseudoalteromonas sp. T1lg23B TaxID=2077097 RepID=UPI0018FE5908|nr:CLCA_X family protein [Pseudoalteromonas sp. T1lg23B]
MSRIPRLTDGFVRLGPDYRFDDQTDFQEIKDTFGFCTITVGSWVTPTEQRISANLVYDALADLAQILAVPPWVIGLNGTLNFAFGAGGQLGVQAHYQPSSRTLALAKNAGAGALAHEWWHAFDHYICKKLFTDTNAMSFASSSWLHKPIAHQHPLNLHLNQFFKLIFLDHKGQGPSQYFLNAKLLDNHYEQFYFSRPQELSARAFEACICHNPIIRNDFLVSGINNSKLASQGGFPNSEHLTQLCDVIFTYFKVLGTALHHRSG